MVNIPYNSFYTKLFLHLIPHIEYLVSSFSSLTFRNLKCSSRGKEGSELVEAVVAWIKVGLFLLQEATDISEKCPSVLVGEIRNGIRDELDDLRSHDINPRNLDGYRRFFSCFWLLSFRCSCLFGWLLENLDIDELVAGDDKWIRSFLLPYAVDCHPRLSKASCESGEVAITRDETKSIDLLRVEDIHSVDDHRGVSSILSSCISVLLDGSDGVFEEEILPLGESWTSPVTIYSLDSGIAILGYLFEHLLDIGGGDIVAVDEDSEPNVGFHN